VIERTTMRGTGVLDGFELRRLRGLGRFITRVSIASRSSISFLCS